MEMNSKLSERLQIQPAFMPVDMSASSGPVSDWVSMKNYFRLMAVLVAAIGTASNDTTITVEQATNVAGSGTVKALNFDVVQVKQGLDMTAIAEFTQVDNPTADNSYTSDTSGEAQLVWLIDIKAEDLDIDGGFDCVRVSVNDHGAAKIGTLLYVLSDPREQKTPMTGAIAN